MCQISLVKGKSIWRITSAVLEKNLYLHTEVAQAKDVIARICTQVIRLVAGQEKDEQLFDTVLTGLRELSLASTSAIVPLEILIMLRMLHLLGYVSEVDTSVCVPYTAYDSKTLESVLGSKSVFVGHINKGLQESQL